MYIVLFGAPGVGKGTQAEVISTRNGIAHLSTGDEFRRNIKEETELGKTVKGIVESGALVPDEVTSAIVQDALKQDRFVTGCLFDGFPRTIVQALALDTMLSEMEKSVTLVVTINVDSEEIVKRMLTRGRADDTESIIRDRLNIYETQTAPVLDFYKAQGKLVEVDGNGTVEEVYARIKEVLPQQ